MAFITYWFYIFHVILFPIEFQGTFSEWSEIVD